MDDIGFILASWVITLGTIGLLAFVTVRRARKLSGQIPDDDKPWL
ncbi:MAG: hypothetical protein RL072_193 [Actinomycetota bacterium]|jgi:hypothetical protein